MANQWLTGAGVPALGTGTVTDYYRDTVSNLVYYRENAFTWVVVPAFTPNPDGIGTTWLHGATAPLTAQGSDGDYFYEDTHKIVYRKEGADWTAKGSLDFIGIYGVQWGNGIGAPASTVPLNALPAGSFYLNVETSDIYYKEPSMSWVLKGQLGASSNIQLLNWAYVQSFAVISAARNANNVITTASIIWPDGATGTFTADTINTTFNTIDAWHATHILSGVTKTVTQTAVTRNADGAVTAQPVITIS